LDVARDRVVDVFLGVWMRAAEAGSALPERLGLRQRAVETERASAAISS
jgi:hypothetical protein